MSPRLYGVLSLGVLGAYAVALGDLQPFPLGDISRDASWFQRALALLTGILLGWGIPGISLALLTSRRLHGAALLARAFGLGIGYICVTSVAYATITGHAPHRTTLLILLTIPCVLAIWRSGRDPEHDARNDTPILVAIVAMVLLTTVLWPKLRDEGMNGDGAETYELSRSLERGAIPRWELEGTDPPRFGTPIAVPYFTGAYLVFGEMMLLGRGELAARIPFVFSLPVLAIVAAAASRRGGPTAWLYTAAIGAVYVLWNAYYVGYEPPFDLAEPAGTDALTIALWIAGAFEVFTGSPLLGAAFMVLAAGTTYAGPLLTVLAVAVLWHLEPARGRTTTRTIAAIVSVLLPALALVGWLSGLWPDWAQQLRDEYWEDLVNPARRVPSGDLFVRFLLFTGGLPLFTLLAWRRLSTAGRTLWLTGAAYLVIVLASSYKNLHYLMPLPWVFLVPVLETAGARARLAAVALLAATFILSWPKHGSTSRHTMVMGTESCIESLPYEEAALAAAPVADLFQEPRFPGQFGVRRHTFVRYALELGGRDCVVGLSRNPPAGATRIADGPLAVWTTDLDRFAGWRFHTIPLPSSRLFPRAQPLASHGEAAEWTGRLDVSTAPASGLLLSGFMPPAENLPARMTDRSRLLIPVRAGGASNVRLGVRPRATTVLKVRVNGSRAEDVLLSAGQSELRVPANWRPGWNVLELEGGEGVELEWVSVSPSET